VYSESLKVVGTTARVLGVHLDRHPECPIWRIASAAWKHKLSRTTTTLTLTYPLIVLGRATFRHSKIRDA